VDAQGQQQAQALTEKQIIQANAQREQQQFDRAQDALQKAMNSILNCANWPIA